MLYQLSFWVVVITILLNVIFGIIIDTFSELRSENLAKRCATSARARVPPPPFLSWSLAPLTLPPRPRRHDMDNVCFICGVDRFQLDTKGNGFDRHIREDHNMWNYLFLLVHLREKDPTEYNGWEQHVAGLMQRSDASFVPVNNAIVLKEHREREEAESRELSEKIADIQRNAQQANDAVAKMALAVERTERQLGGDASSAIGGVLERLDALRELIQFGPSRETPGSSFVMAEASFQSIAESPRP